MKRGQLRHRGPAVVVERCVPILLGSLISAISASAWAQASTTGVTSPGGAAAGVPADGVKMSAPLPGFEGVPGAGQASVRGSSASVPSAAERGLAGLSANPGVPTLSGGVGSGAVPTGAVAVPFGPFAVLPSLGASIGYTDNVGRTLNGSGSALIGLRPAFAAVAQADAFNVAVVYESNITNALSDSRFNAHTHQIGAAISSQFSARADARVGVYAVLGQDAPGLVDYLTGVPRDWTGTGVAASLGYGAPDADGRVEFDLGLTDKRYDLREIADQNDVATSRASSRFYYRIAPRTRLMLEGVYQNFDYRYPAGRTKNSDEYRLRVGAEWNITSITSGSFRIGYVDKRFESGLTASNPDFALALNWTPKSYSRVAVFAVAAPSETTGPGQSRDMRGLGASWAFDVDDRVTARTFATHSRYDFIGADRQDTMDNIGFGTSYAFRRWLRFDAQYAYERRNSNSSGFDYTRNLVMFTATVAP